MGRRPTSRGISAAADRAPTLIEESLRDRVLQRLGFSAPPASDLDGLRAVYSAWCLRVPFDNVAKLIALYSNADGPLPGIDATEFFNRLLDHGAAGTCWPTSNALYELLCSLGFNARLVAGSMRDTGIVSHGSVKVSDGGNDWLVDSSMLTALPLPLTSEVYICGEEQFGAEIEPAKGTHIVWADLPPNATLIPCRLLIDPAKPAFYAERYEASRDRSPFNQRLYAKRNLAGGEKLVLTANTRIRKSAAVSETQELNATQLCESLRDEIGISAALIDEWRRCGALNATFEPSSNPPSPAPGPSPSKRNVA